MKILLVDDEPGSAERLAAGVAAAGIGEVFFATGPEEAVEIVNREGGVDVLATNVFLDGIDGLTLKDAIRAQLPELRSIFFSAYDASEHAARLGDAPLLAKPVDLADLLVAITGDVTGPATTLQAVDRLVGTELGSYRIDALLGADRDGKIYQAVQTIIGRPVELHVLAPGRAADPAEVGRFLANARAKANVSHPALLSVFEAGELAGIFFYASEARPGSSLDQLARAGEPLSTAVLLQLLHTVAEVMVHLGQVKTSYEAFNATHVILDSRHRARLVNIATCEPVGDTTRRDMRRLAAAVEPIVSPHPSSGALQQLLHDMERGAIPVRSWTALIYEVKRCLANGAAQVYPLDADERAEIAAVGNARRRQRMLRRVLVGAAVVLLLLGAGAVWLFLTGRIPSWKI